MAYGILVLFWYWYSGMVWYGTVYRGNTNIFGTVRYTVGISFEYQYRAKIIWYGTIPIGIVPLPNFGTFRYWYGLVRFGTVYRDNTNILVRYGIPLVLMLSTNTVPK